MLQQKVEATLARLRPYLQQHGGDVELVSVEEDSGVVKVRLQGACRGCQMAVMTLKQGIEKALKEEVPEVSEVVAV